MAPGFSRFFNTLNSKIVHGLELDISITIGIDEAKMNPNPITKNSTASKDDVVEKLHFI